MADPSNPSTSESSKEMLHGRYEVQHQLGKQAGRWTLLAQDVVTHQLVILKVLFIDEQMGENDLKLFGREVEVLRSLSHPAIPRYLDYFEIELPRDGKALALVQTYIKGKSLAQLIQEGRKFSEAQVKQVARSLLEILTYLHGCEPPVLHRDIKPSNILLGEQRLYLVDFGSVKEITNRDSSTFTIVGTEGYIAPEQMTGKALIASDLYSMGVTLLALLAGCEASALPRSGMRIAFENVIQPDPALADWLKQMTSPRLDQRFRSAREAMAALG